MRKPIAILAAGSMMLMPMMGAVGMMMAVTSDAYAESEISVASTDYPAGVKAYVGGTRLTSFDPSANGATYDASGGTVKLTGVPSDWTVQWKPGMLNGSTNKQSIMYILSNGSTTYRYWFDGASDAVHTVEELHGLKITLNEKQVEGDVEKGFTIHDVVPSDMKGYEDLAFGWVIDSDNSYSDRLIYTAHPENSDTPSVQYVFMYDDTKPHDSVSSLKNLKAYLTVDGSEVKGFDYTLANSGDLIKIPLNSDVRLEGVPDGWTVTKTGENSKNKTFTLVGPCGDEFDYMFHQTDQYEGYYDISQLQYVRAFVDDELLDEFDYRGGAWSLPENTKTVEIANVPDEWTTDRKVDGNTITYTVSSPNDTVKATYVFNIAKHQASVDELANVKAIVGGNYVSGFNPKQSGTYEYEEGQGISIVNVPSGWTQNVTDGDGYKVYTLSSGDLSVSYRFNKKVKTYSVDELNLVSATTDSGVVEGFNPKQSGTYTIGENDTVWITGIPDDWTVDESDDDMTFTVTSPDKKIKVTYTFKHAAHQYSASELKNVTAQLSNGDYVAGFDPVSGGEFTVPMDTKSIKLDHIPSGWEAVKNGGLSFTLTSEDGSVSVTYTFKAKDGYTVSFDTDGGTTVPTQTIESGKRVTQPDWPTKTGYTFKGWYKDGVPYDFTQPVTDSFTITAKWQVNKYEVVFDTGASDDWYPAQTVEYGGKVNAVVDPTLEGYEFAGWLLNGKMFSFDTPVTGDMTLVASWRDSQVQTHTVTFTGAGDAFTQTVADGSTAIVPTVPSKKGHSFAGWYLGDSLYDFNAPVTDDMTLEAHWTRNTYTVSFDSNGGSDIDPQQVQYNDAVSQPGNPTLDGYEFAGWTLDGDAYDFDTPVTSSITLKAVWKKLTPSTKTHTVKFDTGEGSKIDSQKVDDGNPVSKPDNPTREGYTFNGWLLGGTPYDFTTPVMQDLTLTASWTKNKSVYTVKFDLNDGEGDIAPQKVEEGSTITRPDSPTREGYTFTGWQYEGETWNFLNTVNRNMTLTAQWKKNEAKQYTVTFDSAGGSNVDSQTVKDGGKASKPDNPTREGWEFKGWYLDGTEYDFTQPVKKDTTLKAVWSQIKAKTYTVTFDTDEGTVVPQQTVTENGVAEEPTAPTKTGYTFKGWLSDGKVYDFDTPVTKNLTLKAKWEKSKTTTYTVAFNSDGGNDVASQTVEKGKTATQPDNPTRDGYTFQGWYAGDAPYDFQTPVTGNLVLTAHWTQDETPQPKTYTVTFDPQNGTPAETQTITEGDTATRPETPVKDGYDFQDWVNIDGTPFDFTQPINANVLVSAKWKKQVTYTVTFDTDDGDDIAAQTVKNGSTVQVPDKPSKTGYTFAGWTCNGNAYDFNTPVTSDITLKAVWTESQKPQPKQYTVTFDTDGGGTVNKQTVDEGEKAIKPADPSRDGYEFAGWLLNGQSYDWAAPVTGDITLTASWTQKTPTTHTVSFDTKGAADIPTQTVNDGDKANRPADPERAGYTFTGWTLNGKPYDWNTTVTADMTLTATWQRNETPKPESHTVTFDTGDGSKIDPQTVQQGDRATKPSDPKRDGYTFKSWRSDGKEYDFNTIVSKDMTLTAVWEQVKGSVSWTKTDKENGNILTGSEWTLTHVVTEQGKQHEQTITITDNGDGDTDSRNGSLKATGLAWGEWTLTETKAPSGHSPLDKPITFTIDAQHTDVKLGDVSNMPTADETADDTNGNTGTTADTDGTGRDTRNDGSDDGSKSPLALTGSTMLGAIAADIIAGLGGFGLLAVRLRRRKAK